jgi:hypothetical protein
MCAVYIGINSMKPIFAKLLTGLLVGVSTITAGAAVNKIIHKNTADASGLGGFSLGTEITVTPQDATERSPSVSVKQSAETKNGEESATVATTTVSTGVSPDTVTAASSTQPNVQPKISIQRRHSDDESREGGDD